MKSFKLFTSALLLGAASVATSNAMLLQTDSDDWGFNPPSPESPTGLIKVGDTINLSLDQYTPQAGFNLTSIEISYNIFVKGGTVSYDNDSTGTPVNGFFSINASIQLFGPTALGDPTASFSYAIGNPGNPSIVLGVHDNDEGTDTLNSADGDFPDSDAIFFDLNNDALFPGANDTETDTVVITNPGDFAPFVGAGTFSIFGAGGTGFTNFISGAASQDFASPWTQGSVTVEYYGEEITVPEPATNAAIAVGLISTLVMVRRARRNKKAQA